MVDDRPAERPPDTEATGAEAPKQGLFGLSVPQLLGGACAAVSAAVVASFLGVAGTLIGAALGSLVSTVSAAIYTNMATNAHHRVRGVASRSGRSGSTAVSPAPTGAAPATDRRATTTTTRRAWNSASIGAVLRPRRVLAAAGFIFMVAIGTITALEIGLGHPVSASSNGSSTSIGQAVQDVSGQSGPQTTPTGDAPTGDSSTPTPGSEASQGETAAPTQNSTATDAPTPTPDQSTSQNDPSPEQSAPAQDPPTDSATQDAPEPSAPVESAPAEDAAPGQDATG